MQDHENIREITPDQLPSDAPIQIIDVREPEEFAEVHADGAINIPLGTISRERVAEVADISRPLYLICRSGRRSLDAATQLRATGIEQVINIGGGTLAWIDSGMPVVSPLVPDDTIERS